VYLESKFVIAKLNPAAVGLGVPNVGMRAEPTLAVPFTVDEAVAKPVFDEEIVTIALWPEASPEIVIGRFVPVGVPLAAVPAEVVTEYEWLASKFVTLNEKPEVDGVTLENVGASPAPRIAFPVTEPDPP